MITKSKTPGHFAPTPGKPRGRRIKPNGAETTDGLKQQMCKCGRQFRAEAPGLCAVCAPPGSQPSDAERLLQVETCKECGQIFGAELGSCPVCAANADEKAATLQRQARGAAKKSGKNSPIPPAWESSNGFPAASSASRALEGSTFVDLSIDLDWIEVREQTREDFDEEKIKTLAASIEEHGLLQPPIVRRNYASAFLPYLLVAGERRIRALRRLGREKVKVRDVGEISDAKALTIQGSENLDRKDLNDVERAGWYQRMTAPIEAGGAGLTQEELAKREGVTQAEISNRIRILRAPEWARRLVISGQMSRKHCLELLAFEGMPQVLSSIEKMTRGMLKDGELDPVDSYRRDIRRAADGATGDLSGSMYAHTKAGYRNVDYAVKPTDEEREALGIVKIAAWNGELEERALNKKLAEKLLAKAKAAAIDAAEKKTAKSAKGEQAKAKTLSPAEQQRRAAEQAQQRKRRVDDWFHDWLRVLCAAALTGNSRVVGLFVTWALIEQPVDGDEIGELFFSGAAAKREKSVRLRGAGDLDRLAELTADEAARGARVLAIGLLVDAEGNPRGENAPGRCVSPVPDDVVETLARLLSIDLAAAWRDDRKSAIRERFWTLHSREQLLALGKELGAPLLENFPKSKMVAALLGQQKPLPLPKALAGLVAKAGGKKATGKKSDR